MRSATVSISKIKSKNYFDGYYSRIISTRPVPGGYAARAPHRRGQTKSSLPPRHPRFPRGAGDSVIRCFSLADFNRAQGIGCE